jgi:hypothetical protein
MEASEAHFYHRAHMGLFFSFLYMLIDPWAGGRVKINTRGECIFGTSGLHTLLSIIL